MKIGIFGDSYASLKYNPTKAWYEILSEKYQIENHAYPGSTTFYSVKKFMQYHENYDKIIFIVTMPGRIEFADFVATSIGEKFVPSISQIEHLKQRELAKIGQRDNGPRAHRLLAIKAAQGYFVYLQNDEYDRYVQQLMVKEIKDIRPDIILVNAFHQSTADENQLNNMYIITDKEERHWGIQPVAETDFRNCHMTEENNAIFATKVEEWLNGKPVFIDLKEFVTPDNKDFYIKA